MQLAKGRVRLRQNCQPEFHFCPWCPPRAASWEPCGCLGSSSPSSSFDANLGRGLVSGRNFFFFFFFGRSLMTSVLFPLPLCMAQINFRQWFWEELHIPVRRYCCNGEETQFNSHAKGCRGFWTKMSMWLRLKAEVQIALENYLDSICKILPFNFRAICLIFIYATSLFLCPQSLFSSQMDFQPL